MGDIKIPEGSSLRAAFDAWWAEDHHWGGSLQAACVTAFKAGVAAERAAPAPVAQPARWYMVNAIGMATLCVDRADAKAHARDADIAWPVNAPHRAVQMVEVAAPAPAGDWMAPTTALHRMTEAVALLCRGRRPPDDMVAGWLDGSSEALQDFAAEHGPAWAQGIGLLDAAHIMAGQPTEGVEHEPMPAPAPVAHGITDDDIRRVFLAHGFTIKDGQTDLKPYVFDAARALLVEATGQEGRAE
jgi:hypothetical protein